ncbi:hypothetical protein [Terracidiphilus sp.]|uniref:hypothetical protein n=1 Tax=Terracidiphilus sp. TaxID=1964191 RepID=UPI003C15CAB2
MATPTPVPAPAPKSGGALKIVLIVVGVFVLVVVLVLGALAFIGYRVMHDMGHARNKSEVKILGSTVSTVDSGSFTADDLGVAIYPGATPAEGGSKMEVLTASIVTAVYLTPDPVSKVEAFYKDKFGTVATDFNMGDTAMIVHKVNDKETINVTLTNKNTKDGKTRIMIQHTKAK